MFNRAILSTKAPLQKQMEELKTLWTQNKQMQLISLALTQRARLKQTPPTPVAIINQASKFRMDPIWCRNQIWSLRVPSSQIKTLVKIAKVKEK